MNPLLKTILRRDRKFNFVIFVVWSSLIVDRLLVVAWGEKSCFRLAEISSLMFLVFFKDGNQVDSSRRRDAVIVRGRATMRQN